MTSEPSSNENRSDRRPQDLDADRSAQPRDFDPGATLVPGKNGALVPPGTIDDDMELPEEQFGSPGVPDALPPEQPVLKFDPMSSTFVPENRAVAPIAVPRPAKRTSKAKPEPSTPGPQFDPLLSTVLPDPAPSPPKAPPSPDPMGPVSVESTLIGHVDGDDAFLSPVKSTTDDAPPQEIDSDATGIFVVPPRSEEQKNSPENGEEPSLTDGTCILTPPNAAPEVQPVWQQSTRDVSGNAPSNQPAGEMTSSQTPAADRPQERSSQIWSNSKSESLENLIAIRQRPVSGNGTGPFARETNADFEIVEKLAEGGMGVVYVARQKSLNRELAIKTLKLAGQQSATRAKSSPTRNVTHAERQRREMFLSEALVTANLVHPNIIPIHELAETGDGIPYYVMKRVHGIPWNKQIRQMTLAENLDVLHKVCDAIAFAHHHGVINRDLKPENIMLGEFGEVLVLDWGLAIPAPQAGTQGFKSPSASYGAGTPAYMAPELWTGPEEAIGEASDVYLLGAILYEIITGLPPHEFPSISAGTQIERWKQIDHVLRENRIRSSSESGELMDIALKAMRTEPSERFSSVVELQFAIRNFQRHEESRRLTQRAGELVSGSGNTGEYQTFQTAAALYEEALRTWAQNGPARNGLRATRLNYARLAGDRGDYDLSLQVARLEDDAEFRNLATKIQSARRLRSSIKWTAVAAVICVVLLGAKSIYDNGIITNLNAEVESRRQEATVAITQAQEARDSAAVATRDAETAIAAASKARQDAQAASVEADRAKQEAQIARTEAATEKANAEKAQMAAALAAADAEKSKADSAQSRMEAMAAVAQADAAVLRQRDAEVAAKVAEVEIQSQQVRSLTLSEDYAGALLQVNQLLEGQLLPQLPEELRQQRQTELQAQKEQLLRRTRQSETPVQSSAISVDHRYVALGDATGKLTVLENPAVSADWPRRVQAEIQLPAAITEIHFLSSESLLAASGQEVIAWNWKDGSRKILASHPRTLCGVDVDRELNRVLSADVSGQILIHDTGSGELLSGLTANTALQDAVLIPGSSVFLYAGSRGRQSADILAYRLPEADAQKQRPVRLGQLRMTRSENEPPLKLSISPDGKCLVISNQTDGDLMFLPAVAAPGVAREFPFAHPADLEASGDMSWLVQKHNRPVNDIRWSHDSTHIVTSSDDRFVGVWAKQNDRTPLQFVRFLKGHGARVTQAFFANPSATQIVSCSADRQCRLWDLETMDSELKTMRKAFRLSSLQKSGHSQIDQHAGFSYQFASLQIRDTNEPDETNAQPTQDVRDETSLPYDQSNGMIRALSFDDSGKRLVGGTSNGDVVLWDVSKGEQITSRISDEAFREGHEFHIAQMEVVGQDRSLLATAGYDGTLRLWNLSATPHQGLQQEVIEGIGLVNAFAASPDGKLLASTHASEFSCEIRDLQSLKTGSGIPVIRRLTGVHDAEVCSIAFSLDNRIIATGGRDGKIVLWNADDATVIAARRAHAKNTLITSLCWLPDGTLLSAGMDGQLLRWSMEKAIESNVTDGSIPSSQSFSQLVLHTRFHRDDTPLSRIGVSPDGQCILAIAVQTDRRTRQNQSTLEQYLIDSPDQRNRIHLAKVAGRFPQSITSVRWSDNSDIVLICADEHIQQVRRADWNVTRVFQAGPRVSDACFMLPAASSDHKEQSPSQGLLSWDGNTARLWKAESGTLVSTFRAAFPLNDVTFMNAESPIVITGGRSIRVFNAFSDTKTFGKPIFREDRLNHNSVSSFAVHPEKSNQLAVGLTDGSVRAFIWNQTSQTLEPLWTYQSESKARITAVHWLNHQEQLLAVNEEAIVTTLTSNGQVVSTKQVLADRTVRILDADLSESGHHLALCGELTETSESTGWVMDLKSGELCLFRGHAAGGTTCVRFLNRTPYLVSGGHDGHLMIWNWQQPLPGSPREAYEAFRFLGAGSTIPAHPAPITTLAIHDSLIATAGEDARLSLWQIPRNLQPE